MAAITGTVVLSGIITPSDTRDTFAVTDAQYGRDGLRNVADIPDMLAIPKDRRRVGMMVGVGITANSGNYYYLVNDPETETTLITDWKTFQPGGSITFFDESTNLGSFTKVKFSGPQVIARQDSGDADLLNVFIPPPTFASNFTQMNGVGNGTVTESIVRGTARISTPTGEGIPGGAGNPFKTGGWSATTQSATNANGVVFTTVDSVTGFGGNSKIQVELFDAEYTKIADYLTPNLTDNATHSSTSPFGIVVTISNIQDDSSRKKAKPTISVSVNNILSTIGSQVGGRYQVKITHFTDTATDGSTWIYEQPPIFLDSGGSGTLGFGVPSNRTIAEFDPPTVSTKFLSGVQYYTAGSRFSVTMPNIVGLNRNSQGRPVTIGGVTVGKDDPNFTVSAPNYGLPQINQRAWAPTQGSFENWTNAWNNAFTNYSANDWVISSSPPFRYRGTNGIATGQPFDPWTAGPTGSTEARPILVDTFTTTSTISIEEFNDEARRLNSSYLTWTSSTPLQNGEACVVGGSLVRPDRFFLTDPNTSTIQPNLTSYFPQKGGPNPNYSSFNQEAKYFRKFQTGNNLLFPSFRLVFSGTFPGGSARAALTSENLKIFVRREQSADPANPSGPSSNALRLHGSTEFNSADFDDGATILGSYIRTNAYLSEPNTIEGTLGARDAITGILVEIVIAHQDIRIDRIEFIPEQS